jgi:hypothetical protein
MVNGFSHAPKRTVGHGFESITHDAAPNTRKVITEGQVQIENL